MPFKPKLQYKNIEVPSSLVKVVNTFANICLDNEDSNTALNFKELFGLAEVRFKKLVTFETDVKGKYKTMTLAGFTFDLNGNVEFILKYYIPSVYFNLFNVDFYGPVNCNQLKLFLDYLKKHKQELEDIDTWFKYRLKSQNSH